VNTPFTLQEQSKDVQVIGGLEKN